MPALGAGMDEGRLLEWYVAPGDEVTRGQIVALVDTDKAAIEVEIFESGVIEELLVEEGTKVPVGAPLAMIRAGAATAATPAIEDIAEAPEVETIVAAEAAVEKQAVVAETSPEPVAQPVGRVVSPVVRRLAKDRGVDLATLQGTGTGGIITREDVEHAAAVPAVAIATGTNGEAGRVRSSPYARRLAREGDVDIAQMTGSGPGGAIVARDLAAGPQDEPRVSEEAPPEPPPEAPPERQRSATRSSDTHGDAMRNAIARAMSTSNREIPHYHLGHHVNMEPALNWLTDYNAARRPAERLLPAVLVLKAVAHACRAHPEMNGFWVDDALRRSDDVHIGVAIALRGGGLVTPAIHDVDGLGLDELMSRLRDLVARVRAGRMRGSELTDATITVTNLGDQGVETVRGVIYPPQVALVGVGRILERPWAVDGLVGARRVAHVTVAADHRASDGHSGALFLSTIDDRLQEPETL
jgi:pyruvate dehydrogenase E2 component (dihydrolipoamide acetyltransferase)